MAYKAAEFLSDVSQEKYLYLGLKTILQWMDWSKD